MTFRDKSKTTIWRIGPRDLWPLFFIAILPLLAALPLLLGFLDADPAIRNAAMASSAQGFSAIGLKLHLLGAPVIDNNAGLTTQSLGYRAALEILHGRMPWWNAYGGVGLPLAAEYQPAAFFPLTFLLLLPQGMLIEHLLLQMLAGWGTYVLLRQLNIGPLAALTAGVLYAFDGTLAWFDHGPALSLPFLPWMLLGIERARAKAELGVPGGWRIFAVALALALLAGFPEAAYLNGLMVLGWALLRLGQLQPRNRWAYAWRIGLGGAIGILLAAPQIFAFLQYLPNAVVPGHGADLREFKIDLPDIIPSLIAPYFFGPIFALHFDGVSLLGFPVMTFLGGYVSAAIVVVAFYGLLAKPNPLNMFLAGWTLLALGKMFGLQPAAWLWNIVPGANLVFVCRYIQPTWTLALVVLAASGLDCPDDRPCRQAFLGAGLVAVAAIGVSLIWALTHWTTVHANRDLHNWLIGSLVWVSISVAICLGTLARPAQRIPILAALLMAESMMMFVIPTLSNPPGGAKLDMAAVDFLHRNLGLYRFYTLGPIPPNYGAYFGIASINEGSSPAPKRWATWLPHLDVEARVEDMAPGPILRQIPQIRELQRNLTTFEWAGVKYVLASASDAQAAGLKLKAAYSDSVMTIYELPHPSPYFQIVAGRCAVAPFERTYATFECSTPATLVRRELFYPGWSATVNGTVVPITIYRNLFQTIALPRGKNAVQFAFAPPHMAWMWLATLLGLSCLAISSYYLRPGKKGHYDSGPKRLTNKLTASLT